MADADGAILNHAGTEAERQTGMPCQVDAQFKCGISTVASVNIFHLAAACLTTKMEIEEETREGTSFEGPSFYESSSPVDSSPLNKVVFRSLNRRCCTITMENAAPFH